LLASTYPPLYHKPVTTSRRRAPVIPSLFRTATALAALSCTVTALAQDDGNASTLPTNTFPRISVQTEAAPDLPDRDDGHTVEIFRLRIANRQDGAIQISTDAGATWRLIGRVLVPATGTQEGYIAAEYARPGTVAATAVHGHRIRVSGSADAMLHAPRVISIDPKEYVNQSLLPDSYGGHRPGVSGIYTDIAAGTSLFRDLAPITGDTVYLERNHGLLFPLKNDFAPKGDGEVLVIPVRAPKNPLTQVVFENHGGGKVEATFADGTTRSVTQVIQPVLGIGRFDGTSYTGVGRLNTAHTGVITVSTAPVNIGLPEGQGAERRGGFQIEPAWHNARTEEAGAPMVMALGAFGQPRKRTLEGQAPLFHGMVTLGETDPKRDIALQTAMVEMSVDDGPWEPLPAATGYVPDLFTGPGLTRYWKQNNIARTATRGVTAFRMQLPQREPVESRRVAEAVANNYDRLALARARTGDANTQIVNGVFTVNANPLNTNGVVMARLSIEGETFGISNVSPFALSWDTRNVADGEYLVESEALSNNGAVLARTHTRVFVLNHKPAVASSTSSGSR